MCDYQAVFLLEALEIKYRNIAIINAIKTAKVIEYTHELTVSADDVEGADVDSTLTVSSKTQAPSSRCVPSPHFSAASVASSSSVASVYASSTASTSGIIKVKVVYAV